MLWMRTPEKVYFKRGCTPVALDELRTIMGKKRCFIVTDSFLYKNGYTKAIEEKLNQMGVLTEIDRSAFAAYCQSYARWKEAQEHIDSEGATYETENGMQRPNPWVAICNTEQRLMMQAASEFGLTPSARSRIMAASGVGKDEEDEMEALLGGEA